MSPPGTGPMPAGPATSLLYVPTNRRCTEQIGELLAEAGVIAATRGRCVAALVEHAEEPWTPEHAAALASADRPERVSVMHATREATARFLRAVVARARVGPQVAQRLGDLLDPDGVAYGAGPNKAALLAIALGADVVHRRDSDVRADHWASGPAYPCVPESEVIGTPVSAPGVDGPVLFAGTSSFGNPPHDRRDLMAAGEGFVVDLELLASPGESHEALLNETRAYLVRDPMTRYQDDFTELDPGGRTTMSACAMAGVFRQLPEMPMRGTLGTDYLRRNLLRFCGSPIMFHSRKVVHRYDPGRAAQADAAAVNDYAHRDLRHLIVWPVLASHHRRIQHEPQRFMTAGCVDVDAYCDSLHSSLEASLPVMAGVPARFADVYRRAAAAAGDAAAGVRLLGVAESVESGPDFVGEVVAGLDDFAFLVRYWPSLVQAAEACRSEARALES